MGRRHWVVAAWKLVTGAQHRRSGHSCLPGRRILGYSDMELADEPYSAIIRRKDFQQRLEIMLDQATYIPYLAPTPYTYSVPRNTVET